MCLQSTLSGHKVQSDESRATHALFWGSHSRLIWLMPAQASVRPVKQEAMSDF